MKCQKCEGRGFTELEYGLIMVECEECGGTGEKDDSNIGVGQDNQPTGSGDTSQPKQPKKRKAKKKARARTG